jgi:hypothetical protein
MAFLDNSGDIILDAVLTDLGRKRLAEGNFRITQFALGDDEVDYGLYDKDHPSGSAYYDLEILQTPVFEAFTQDNANINYGLISLNGITDILYMPSMPLNQKQQVNQNTKLSGGIAYVGANGSADSAELNSDVGSDRLWLASAATTRGFVFETGLNSADGVPDRTQSNRDSYLVSNGLVDSEFIVSFDSRFISNLLPILSDSVFSYPEGTGTVGSADTNIVFSADPAPSNAAASALENYKSSVIPAVQNLIFKQTTDDDLNYSEVNGPRAAVTGFSLTIAPDLQSTATTSPAYYTLYGQVNQTIGSNQYDYIDTTIYVMGATTGVTAQLPVRIIRKRG